MAIVENDAFHRAIGKKKSGNKYRNTKVVIGKYTFDSTKEGRRWVLLQMLQKHGTIRGLERQVPFKCVVNGVKVCTFCADFTYEEYGVTRSGIGHRLETKWKKVCEDVKSDFTRKLPVYRLKKKLVKACFGIEIQEV